MFEKVLIANRGEIAVRIIRACRELDIRTVAIFSEPDEDALHVRLADEAYCVGPAQAARSYLHVPAIIEVASKAGVDAIHPGYGFLAENSHFAAVAKTWGITFVGPSPDAIEQMGFKSVARELMIKAGVPVVPGTDDTLKDEKQALAIAAEIGYPVLVKASAGGGGRGIRIAQSAEELSEAVTAASREAQSIFGSGDIYLEKYLVNPRHIEIQILADHEGQIVHLGERECSIQRRRQKILEEAPSAALTPELRQNIAAAAIKAAQAVDYTNAGTVEFLLDENGQFYFIEMNTRIQVEHTLSEVLTGIDIVKEQLRIAAGQPLRFAQADVTFRGWALQCRINAEDPDNRFMPSPGTITEYQPPAGPGIRWDEGIYAGYSVQPFYDSLIGKLIASGSDRAEAIARMRRALAEFRLEGVKTTIELHQRILSHADFESGRSHTNWLEDELLGGT
ncbi:MAG: acetyl-CoA carboxylase biotin carboxylase subunit [Thermaerobacterales bacterium]